MRTGNPASVRFHSPALRDPTPSSFHTNFRTAGDAMSTSKGAVNETTNASKAFGCFQQSIEEQSYPSTLSLTSTLSRPQSKGSHSMVRTRPLVSLSLSLLPTLVRLGTTSVTADASADCTVQLDGTCVSSLPRLECGVYMAPSTLGEDTNLGIYTGKALRTDDVVNFPEIAIPLLFREWGEHVEGIADGALWDRYIWEGEVADLETYTDRNRIDNRAVFVPGVGCTVNSVLDMNNIESTHGSTYDTAGLHRSRDPGTGAFSPYHSALTTAVTDIAPGAELFASYGDYWVPSIPGVQVTLDEVLDVTEDFLQNDLYEFVQSHRDADALTPDVKEALFAFVKDFPLPNQPFSNLPRNVPWADVERAIHEAGTHRKHTDTTTDNVSGESSVARQFIREQSIRDLAWLDEHGYCQDHLRPGRSTLPQAGRGAFATRNLPAGSVVGYAPLIHIGLHGREVLRITYPPSEHDHHVGNDDNDGENGTTPRTSYDLVLNYSFAHRNSTVILTPYGGMYN
ncbi:predicted protein [Phaeodactylum tricornutum CCAP 1055/1]|uniref:SET domain-containing protein n=1 Tax=Phaeodactylum tricornutum (strain CCAP 1055/1) TaxID=556484 RepID=B7FVC9_PHATC|nr:predicted protein [Phaeodactylum tricornutum CCAP 1055/1]EEC49604.1 predicted protein [Phaeodactylum tricornutum CCAP 1055/1]|eukprot:XP_002178906.1 predicted protein [Phaeodactylum tricornutum CCAP 1055/1]